MKEILAQLNQEVGVKGSIVVGPDGILIESLLETPQEKDLIAAIASTAINSIKEALVKVGTSRFDQFILEASFGKMVFVDTGNVYLVALLDKGINLDNTLIAVNGAAHRLASTARIK